MYDFQPVNPDQRNVLVHLAFDCLEEAAGIICGRTYGYGLAGADLERVGQAMKQLLQELHDARWVLADPARWRALQTELRAQEAESDSAFRAFMRSLLLRGET